MIRKGKRYVRPKKLYEKSRIEDENKLAERYGLKNKREIWKSLAKVSYFRRRAKSLAKASPAEQEVLFGKLQALGFNTHTIADVLALNIEDLLRRRLPTVVAQKGFAHTVQHARQLVVHKKVRIDGKVINIPSYLVTVTEESQISVDAPKVAPKKAPAAAEDSEAEKPEVAA